MNLRERNTVYPEAIDNRNYCSMQYKSDKAH